MHLLQPIMEPAVPHRRLKLLSERLTALLSVLLFWSAASVQSVNLQSEVNMRKIEKPYYGISAYAAAAWDGDTKAAYFASFPTRLARPATAVIWGTFGNPIAFIGEFIDTFEDRKHLIEIHISNECARRTGRNGKQICPKLPVAAYNAGLMERDPKVLMQVRRRVTDIVRNVVAIEADNTKIVLCVGLEDNLNDDARFVLVNEVQAVLIAQGVDWEVVTNPMTVSGANHSVEIHGRAFPKSFGIWNFDGVHVGEHPNYKVDDIAYGNATALIKNADKRYKAVFLWSAYAQDWDGTAKPYTGRTFTIPPEEVKGFRAVLKEISKRG